MFGCSRGAGAAAVLSSSSSSRRRRSSSLSLSCQSCGRLSVGQSVDEPIDLPADALPFAADMGNVRPGLRLKAIPFGGEFLREDLEQVRIHEPAAQAVHHRRLERVPADGQTIAADGLAFVARGRAAEMRLADLGEAAAADAATHQTRKEIARPPLRPEWKRRVSRLDRPASWPRLSRRGPPAAP